MSKCVDCGSVIQVTGQRGPVKQRCEEHEAKHKWLKYVAGTRDTRYLKKERRTSCIVCEEPFAMTNGKRGPARRISTRKNVCDTPSCMRDYRWWREWGVSPGTYDKLYEEQRGKCALCDRWYERLSLDHCHETMRVRGLLCRSCNGALGQFGDNKAGLEKALRYVLGVVDTNLSDLPQESNLSR